MNTKMVYKTITMPEDILRQIKNEAKTETRSVNGQIIFMLKKYFEIKKEEEEEKIIKELKMP